ncbi:MAG TPA: hypothetical protein H9856_04265 [Candidatus Limosilactobacillus merdigallinarum]|uniref:Uncharacterized protein n=1 Tax=Candidatus Limosilactobacillus merdigallinarum TaxID=2838652 RepID=A0A9D1VHN0_9LACO|nr:hypothetical protein [Candidatus Limosilactobacillus merdigallinarum]
MNDNYQFLLADDHKGNKVLAVIKGELSMELVKSTRLITDKRFNHLAQQLKKIIDSSSVTDNDK